MTQPKITVLRAKTPEELAEKMQGDYFATTPMKDGKEWIAFAYAGNKQTKEFTPKIDNQEKPTEKQIAYLFTLGFEGNAEGLTKMEVSKLIEELKNKRSMQ